MSSPANKGNANKIHVGEGGRRGIPAWKKNWGKRGSLLLKIMVLTTGFLVEYTFVKDTRVFISRWE